MLIVSPDSFNQATGLPVTVPITSGGGFTRRLGLAVPLEGLKTTGIVRCDQPRVIDLKASSGRRAEELSAPLLDEVLARLATLFE